MNFSMEVDEFPENMECSKGKNYVSESGGKAVNQAFAAARSGARVALVGKVGEDLEGGYILDNIRKDGVITSGVGKSEKMQTASLITIKGEDGNHRSIYMEGANSEVTADQVPDEVLKKGNLIMLQMDLPIEENIKLLERANKNGCKSMLNLSPYKTIPTRMLEFVDYLVIHSSELDELSGVAGENGGLDAMEVAKALAKEGKLDCIITRGKEGALCVTRKKEIWETEALKFDEIVDKTGAGDVFCGTLAASLHAGKPFLRALKRASVAATMTCMDYGGISSYPYMNDVDQLINELEDPVKK